MSKKAKKDVAGTNGRATSRPDAKVRDYDHHVLICNGGDCKKRGSKDMRKLLKRKLRSAGVNGEVRVDTVGCLGLCKHGPNAIVYPSGTWYLGLGEEMVSEVVGQHLNDGKPVEHLAAGFRSRKKK